MAGRRANVPFCSLALGERPGAGTAEDGYAGEMALQFFGAVGREEIFLHRHQTPWMPFGVSGGLPNPSFLPAINL